MSEHIHNALLDPCAEFALVPSARLRELCALDEHPVVKRMTPYMKMAYMSCPAGKALPVDPAIVRRYVLGQSTDDERFVLDLCDIRFWATNTPLPPTGDEAKAS